MMFSMMSYHYSTCDITSDMWLHSLNIKYILSQVMCGVTQLMLHKMNAGVKYNM
jgi:hypothetical protein